MLRLFGMPVRPGDARALVAALLAVGSPGAIDAALEIERGLERRAALVALKPEHRTAILFTLEDLPPGLQDLRVALVQDYVRRRAGR